ncbi:DUF4386 domain-containing protein [Cellulomonas sp.]|uniref:DUF4386 domain-containing protein n=1 Tax=Cellulomonas sp. TaxID=40001 RepID=UPI0028127A94|nr:DUF4386 domain-containing protein [Cellulomonas sp.]
MHPTRRTAALVGVFFVVAAVTAVVALAFYQPALADPEYVLGAGADAAVLTGVALEVLLAASVVGTGVALYPVMSRYGRATALGYALGRLAEALVILVGVVAVLAVVTLRQVHATSGGDPDALVTVARGLVAVHDATFLVGPGLIIGVNTTLLAWLVRRSGLVAGWIPVVGLVGGPLVLASSTAVLFGAYSQVSPVAGLGALPVFVWEMSLAGYLLLRGFRSPAQAPEAVAEPSGRVAATVA